MYVPVKAVNQTRIRLKFASVGTLSDRTICARRVTRPDHRVFPFSFPQYEKPSSVYQPPPVFYDDVYQNWAGRLPPSGYPYDPLPRYDSMALQPQRSPFADQPLPLPPGGLQTKLGQVAPPVGWADQQPIREMVSEYECENVTITIQHRTES